MTTEDNEALAEHAARAHLGAWHPAITAAYATDVPHLAILLDLREAGVCTCLLGSDMAYAVEGLRRHLARL